MKQVSNQSVKALTETLIAHLQDNGYSAHRQEMALCLVSVGCGGGLTRKIPGSK